MKHIYGERKEWKSEWHIIYKLYSEQNPFILPRKKIRISPLFLYTSNHYSLHLYTNLAKSENTENCEKSKLEETTRRITKCDIVLAVGVVPVVVVVDDTFTI